MKRASKEYEETFRISSAGKSNKKCLADMNNVLLKKMYANVEHRFSF